MMEIQKQVIVCKECHTAADACKAKKAVGFEFH